MEDLDIYTNYIVIDLGIVKSNYKSICDYISKKNSSSEVGLVLKSDAYGTGIKDIASIVYSAGARKFFVVTLDEAILLKKILPNPDVYVLSGLLKNTESIYITYGIIPVLYTKTQINRWIDYASKISKKLPCIIKFDTGMNRMGIRDSEYSIINDPNVEKFLNIKYILSHTYCSYMLSSDVNEKQLERIETLKKRLPQFKTSFSNTYSAFLDSKYYSDLFRVGRALYGVFDGVLNHEEYPNITKCAFSVYARVMQIKDVKKGETVSYGATYTFEKDTRIATLGIGYSHGLPVSLSNKGYVMINNRKAKILGKITMEYTMVDITGISDIEEESWKCIIPNDGNFIDSLAAISGITSLELMAAFSRGMQKKIYLNNSLEGVQ